MIYWSIEKYDDRDYTEKLWSSWVEERKFFSNIIYNQKLVDNYSCTWCASLWSITDITWFKFPLFIQQLIWDNQLKTWAKKGFWDTFLNWVKQATKIFNLIYSPVVWYKLEYLRATNLNLETISEILKTSSIITWYYWVKQSDAQDNWVVDILDNNWTAWHCIRLVKLFKDDWIWNVKYCDNYDWVQTYNIITIKDFMNNKDFYKAWYYLKKIYE